MVSTLFTLNYVAGVLDNPTVVMALSIIKLHQDTEVFDTCNVASQPNQSVYIKLCICNFKLFIWLQLKK